MAFRRIGLTCRSVIERKEELLDRIVRVVEGAGADICIDAQRCDVPLLKRCNRFEELKELDLIIILGGDGTILRTVRELKDFSIPLLAVNRGRVGFLAEVDTKDIATLLPPLLGGAHTIEERQMLQCRVERNGKTIIFGHVLNEVVIHQGAIARLIDLRASVNGAPLTDYRADGIIIATPTGSTAYNLAAGGPIVHPTLETMILTPINPYAFSQKPLVIPAAEEVSVEILPRESKFEDITVSLTFDGQVHHPLCGGDRITVSRHPEKIRFLRLTKDTFYDAIRRKLQWGG
jgi:NAD+ kinase